VSAAGDQVIGRPPVAVAAAAAREARKAEAVARKAEAAADSAVEEGKATAARTEVATEGVAPGRSCS
tara:strand:- start:7938 stop:8138 length:201 start_codon:yes stop_codon:yes gene_type:complete